MYGVKVIWNNLQRIKSKKEMVFVVLDTIFLCQHSYHFQVHHIPYLLFYLTYISNSKKNLQREKQILKPNKVLFLIYKTFINKIWFTLICTCIIASGNKIDINLLIHIYMMLNTYSQYVYISYSLEEGTTSRHQAGLVNAPGSLKNAFWRFWYNWKKKTLLKFFVYTFTVY